MREYLADVDEDSEIRQGDVLRFPPGNSQTSPKWACVITADCDIAQKKAGEHLTCLEIIPANQYLNSYWAKEQLRKLVEKQSRVATEGVNGLLRRANHELDVLTESSLCAWLESRSADEIIAAIGAPSKIDRKLEETLNALRVALGREGPSGNLERLKSAWALLGHDHKAQQSRLREAFDPDRGFPDFVLVPALPEAPEIGYVILLRSIFTIAATNVFPNELAARIEGRVDAYHRIGRFSDGLRFAVAQKLAFLFSRIGMATEFEEACEKTAFLLAQSVYDHPQGGEKI